MNSEWKYVPVRRTALFIEESLYRGTQWVVFEPNDEPLWAQIAQANGLPASRYVVRVLPTEELNAFACGGHLVLVTSFAVHELTQSQLRGVLAHELSHHLGLHTVAITIGHWLSAPVVLLARIGFYFENVAQAAAESFGRRSPPNNRKSCRRRKKEPQGLTCG